MNNPFETLDGRLTAIEQKIDRLLTTPPRETRIAAPDYCRRENISRQTFYNRAARGMYAVEKIGGRNYIKVDSIKV